MASPFLTLPLDEKSQKTNSLSLFSLKDKKASQLINLVQNLQDHRCVGSSHGWLVFLDAISNLYLINPFSRTRIQLPEKHTIPQFHLVKQRGYGCFGPENLGPRLIVKVALSANPSADKNYIVVIMYDVPSETRLAFCKNGDEAWSGLEGEASAYYDIVCTDDRRLFALGPGGPGPVVASWDLNESVPCRKIVVQDSCPRKLAQDRLNFPSDLYSSQWYLALSSGVVYFIVRYIGEFVRYDGAVVYEGDTLTDYAAEPLVCPYKTIEFHVYKLDLDQKTWTEVESLDEFSLFLGGNQSLILSAEEHPELERNSIYFTDDYWDRMDEDYSYGGHDLGIFKLEDGGVGPVMEFQERRIEPPPFWVIHLS